MRILAFLALAALIVGCSPKSGVQPAPDIATSYAIADFKDLSLGEPIHEGALTLIPVSRSNQQERSDEYVTLAEATKRGWIEIIELPGEASVETLRVRYSGEKPLLLLAGELLLGGKQDRVVAKDTVIKPGETVDVMVFCVEPGRWDGDSMHFDPQVSTVPLETKEKAILGNQQDVWNSVGEYNLEAAPDAKGSSLRHGYSRTTNSKEFNASLDRALTALRGRKDVVGVVIVLGGTMHSFEYFGSSLLFSSSAESVIRGALASAAIEKESRDLPAIEDVAGFVGRSLNSARANRARDGYASFDDGLNQVAGGMAAAPGEDAEVLHGVFYDKSKK